MRKHDRIDRFFNDIRNFINNENPKHGKKEFRLEPILSDEQIEKDLQEVVDFYAYLDIGDKNKNNNNSDNPEEIIFN